MTGQPITEAALRGAHAEYERPRACWPGEQQPHLRPPGRQHHAPTGARAADLAGARQPARRARNDHNTNQRRK